MNDNRDMSDVLEEVSADDHPPADEVEDDSISVSGFGSRGRGRPRIAEVWTRVISLQHDDLQAQLKYPLGTDLLLAQNLPRTLYDGDGTGWQPFFLAKDFVKANFAITTELFRMEEAALLQAAQ